MMRREGKPRSSAVRGEKDRIYGEEKCWVRKGAKLLAEGGKRKQTAHKG